MSHLYARLTPAVVIAIAGLAASYVVLSPKGRTHRWTRTLTFIALGLSSVIPVIHIIALYGFRHARQKFSLDLLIAGGASYIVGAVL
jgi:adiponectin receptor